MESGRRYTYSKAREKLIAKYVFCWLKISLCRLKMTKKKILQFLEKFLKRS
jgi:hypothetical protein